MFTNRKYVIHICTYIYIYNCNLSDNYEFEKEMHTQTTDDYSPYVVNDTNYFFVVLPMTIVTAYSDGVSVVEIPLEVNFMFN
jgi:hypothetical protein